MDINLPGFLFVLLPIALSPGASFTLAINSALTSGRSGLFKTLIGTALGIYTHAFLIGFGITTLLTASPTLSDILKTAGTAYLFWLGIQFIRHGLSTQQPEPDSGDITGSIRNAWLANVLNPKAIVFYLTVVSQFAGRHGETSHYLVLASIHIVVMCLWLIIVSSALVFSTKSTNPATLKKYVNSGGGIVLIIFAVKSLFS